MAQISTRAALTLLLVLPACGASYGLRGQIGALERCEPATKAPRAEGEPLAGVRVSVLCPDGTSRSETTTDARGTFSLLKGMKLDASCEVVLEKAGYDTRRYPARDLCASENNDGNGPYCGLATELSPTASSGAAR